MPIINDFCSTKLNHGFLMVQVKTKLITSGNGSKRLDMCEIFNKSIVGDEGSLKEVSQNISQNSWVSLYHVFAAFSQS